MSVCGCTCSLLSKYKISESPWCRSGHGEAVIRYIMLTHTYLVGRLRPGNYQHKSDLEERKMCVTTLNNLLMSWKCFNSGVRTIINVPYQHLKLAWQRYWSPHSLGPDTTPPPGASVLLWRCSSRTQPALEKLKNWHVACSRHSDWHSSHFSALNITTYLGYIYISKDSWERLFFVWTFQSFFPGYCLVSSLSQVQNTLFLTVVRGAQRPDIGDLR